MSYCSLGKKTPLNIKKVPCQKWYCIPVTWRLVESLAWLHALMHKGFFPVLSVPSLGPAAPGCHHPDSRGYTPIAAAPLGISHGVESCFSSHALEVRQGRRRPERRFDRWSRAGGIDTNWYLECLLSCSLGTVFPNSNRVTWSHPVPPYL